MPSLTVGIATVSPAVGVTAEPLRLKVNCCAPTVQFSTPVKLPATALLKVTMVDAEPAGGTAKFNGATENSGAVGAVQTAAAAVTPGFWNAMVEVGDVFEDDGLALPILALGASEGRRRCRTRLPPADGAPDHHRR